LAFYTDGLSEARNKRNEEYGEERLIKTIEENHNLSTEQLKEKIIDDVILFMDHQNLHDDLTLILVKIK
jgi:serine phosphatase RsbU (regulator of sigma subunit)